MESSSSAVLREPNSRDGVALHELISQCPPLDVNSIYCNLLHCSHFASTSVAAEQDSEITGFISSYLVPNRPDTVFVWQVAVGEKARGQGLALKMLNHILARPACSDVKWLETTITPDNAASNALFGRLAESHGASLEQSVMFDRDADFQGRHDTELLTRIGPLAAQ